QVLLTTADLAAPVALALLGIVAKVEMLALRVRVCDEKLRCLASGDQPAPVGAHTLVQPSDHAEPADHGEKPLDLFHLVTIDQHAAPAAHGRVAVRPSQSVADA